MSDSEEEDSVGGDISSRLSGGEESKAEATGPEDDASTSPNITNDTATDAPVEAEADMEDNEADLGSSVEENVLNTGPRT